MSNTYKKKPEKKNSRRAGKAAHVDRTTANAGKAATADRTAVRLDLAEGLSMIPAVLMCGMLLIMLAADILLPEMSDRQYDFFPSLFEILDYLIILGGLVCIGLSAKRRTLTFEKSDALFAGFGLLILISTFVNGFDPIDISGVPYRFIGIFNMLAFMLIYMGVTRTVERESYRDFLLYLYMATADLIGLAALCDRLGGGAIEAFGGKKELSAIFFNGNHYGYFLMMAVLIGTAYWLFGRGRAAAFGSATAGLNLALLMVNHSLGSILALLIVLAATAIMIMAKGGKADKQVGGSQELRRLGLMAAVLIAAFVVAVAVSPAMRKEFTGLAADLGAILSGTAEGSAGHRRLQMWTLTAGYIAERPLLGYGCESIAFMLYEAMKVSDPHSELLGYAAAYGIPAALLYVAGVASVIIRSIQRSGTNGAAQKAACMAATGYFLSSLVGVGMFYTLPFFFILLGLANKTRQ